MLVLGSKQRNTKAVSLSQVLQLVQRGVLCVALATTMAVFIQPAGQARTTEKITCAMDAPAEVTADFSKVRLTGLDQDSPEYETFTQIVNSLLSASNKHSIDGVIKYYSPQFVSGDNMSLADLKALILETWDAYPTISYESVVNDIRVSGDWATVETSDVAHADLPSKSQNAMLSNMGGTLDSESKNQLHFKRTGNDWQIVNDNVLYEQAIIRYGAAKELDMNLETPELVKSGESYSAIFAVEPPEGTFVIAAISNQELVYPHESADDKFRPMNSSNQSIQRVLKANVANRNEIVTASVGITRITENETDRPSIGLDGIATIVKRINVIPTSKQEIIKAMQNDERVRRAANGKIDLDRLMQQLESNQSNVPSIKSPAGL